MKKKYKIIIPVVLTALLSLIIFFSFVKAPIESYYHSTGLDTSFSYGYWHLKDGKIWLIMQDHTHGLKERRVCCGDYNNDEENNITLNLEDGRKFTSKIGWVGFKINEKMIGNLEEHHQSFRVINPLKTSNFNKIKVQIEPENEAN